MFFDSQANWAVGRLSRRNSIFPITIGQNSYSIWRSILSHLKYAQHTFSFIRYKKSLGLRPHDFLYLIKHFCLCIIILNSKCKIRPLTLRTLNYIYRSVQPYFDCCSLVWGNCSKKRVFLSNSVMYNYNIRRSKFDISKPKGRDTLGDKSL